jgi:hypothetical protein
MTRLGVMKVANWKSESLQWPGAMYRIMCACGSPDCDTTIDFHYEDGIFQTHIYHKMHYPYWKADNWFEEKWLRVKAAVKLLFTGDIDVESDTTITDPEHIQGIIDTFKEAQTQMESYSENLAQKWIETLADNAKKDQDAPSKN